MPPLFPKPSTLITSAPRSPSSIAPIAPDIQTVRSMTRTPSSGPAAMAQAGTKAGSASPKTTALASAVPASSVASPNSEKMTVAGS